MSQANIEDKFLKIETNQFMLPEEMHLRGMTVFSKSKKHCGEYDGNVCTKNEVGYFFQALFFHILCIKIL